MFFKLGCFHLVYDTGRMAKALLQTEVGKDNSSCRPRLCTDMGRNGLYIPLFAKLEHVLTNRPLPMPQYITTSGGREHVCRASKLVCRCNHDFLLEYPARVSSPRRKLTMRLLALLPIAFAGCALAAPAPKPEELDPRNWPSVTSFLSKLVALFPADMLVQDACGLITGGENVLGTIFDIPSTQNDACGDVTVLFARGTCDSGNVGVLTGPWFFKALGSALKATGRSLGVQGLEYAASVDGYLTGNEVSGQDLLVFSVSLLVSKRLRADLSLTKVPT